MGRSRGRTRNLGKLLFSSFGGFLIPLFCLSLTATNAQQTLPAQNPDSNNAIPEVRTTPTTGSLPSSTFDPSSLIRQNLPGAAKTSAAPAQLSLSDAINLALQNNLATLSAQEERRAASGFSQQARSALLPNISGVSYQANLTTNIAALGFQAGTFPGIQTAFIGPFNNFDARARLVQNIFDLSSIRNFQSTREGVRIAEFRQQLAREEVSEATALTYLETLRSERNVSAAQANVTLAEALLKLAQDQRTAGVATGVDVTRAETRLAQERVNLSQSQTSSEQARLNLQRIIGVPLDSPLVLVDPLRFTIESLPTPEAGIAQALSNRNEVLIAESQLRMLELERKAVKGELLPSLQFVGDYGVSGITPTDTALPTRRVAVQLNVPIFNGGLTQGRLTVASSREREAELQLGSVRGQVEQDVRLALATLRTSLERVRAADEAVSLAERELEMSRDRFRAGVADNLEVINAQTSLANARAAQVQALAVYNAARLNLAASLGRAETFRW